MLGRHRGNLRNSLCVEGLIIWGDTTKGKEGEYTTPRNSQVMLKCGTAHQRKELKGEPNKARKIIFKIQWHQRKRLKSDSEVGQEVRKKEERTGGHLMLGCLGMGQFGGPISVGVVHRFAFVLGQQYGWGGSKEGSCAQGLDYC